MYARTINKLYVNLKKQRILVVIGPQEERKKLCTASEMNLNIVEANEGQSNG